MIRVNWAIDKSNTAIGFTLSAIFAVVSRVILHARRNSVEFPAFRNITPVYRVTVLRIMYPFVDVMDTLIHLNAFRNVLVSKWPILSIDRVEIIIHAEMQIARTMRNALKIDKFACQSCTDLAGNTNAVSKMTYFSDNFYQINNFGTDFCSQHNIKLSRWR